MYKLIIADDEKNIVEGICNFVNWNDMGYEIVFKANDGSEVIDYLKNNTVDVILTDIVMISVSGLDVAEYVYKNKIDTNVVILSGYGEFEYAQKAISYGVSSYVLKPTSPTELHKVFSELKIKLDEKSSLKQDTELMRKQLFLEICVGIIKKPDKIESRLRKTGLNIDIQNDMASVVNVRLNNKDEWKYDKENFSRVLCNFINLDIKPVFVTDILEDDMTFRFVVIHKQTFDGSVFERIRRSLADLLSLDVVFQLEASYRNVCDMAEKHYIKAAEKTSNNLELYKQLSEQQTLLITYFMEGKKQMSADVLSAILNEISGIELSIVKSIIGNLFITLVYKLNVVKTDNATADYVNEMVDAIHISESFEEISNKAEQALNKLFGCVDKNDQPDSSIDKLKKYVDENYDMDITLNDLSKLVYLSPAYIGNMFKSKTGKTFTEYLTDIRIEQAKKLIENSDLKIYEICERVGYKTPRYFYRIFRANLGVTPQEYREKVRGKK